MDRVEALPERDICSEIRLRVPPESGRAALVAPGRQGMDHDRLWEHVQPLASLLAGRGFRRGDAVALVLPDGPEFLVAFLAVSQVAVCAPLNPAFRQQEFEYFMKDLRAQAVIVLAGVDSPVLAVARLAGIDIIAIEPDLDGPAGAFRILPGQLRGPSGEPAYDADTAFLLHTSATTGQPKLVPITHGQLIVRIEVIQKAFPPEEGGRTLMITPQFHLQGILNSMVELCSGSSVICTPGFRPDRFRDWMAEYAPTQYTANPTLHRAILSLAQAEGGAGLFRSLRFVTSIGAPLGAQSQQLLERALGVPVIDCYGLTESGRVTRTPSEPGLRKAGSVGVCIGPEVGILGPDRQFLGAGATGEILLRGPMVMRGYAHNPEANANAFLGDWFRTGDLGYLDDQGYLFITGRLKEMINRGAEKVLPYEVEAVLLRHPEVREAAVFGVPHPRLGEDVAAVVVPVPGTVPDAEALRRFAGEYLTQVKIPRRILFLPEIPKGRTGKVQRTRLAEQLGVDWEAQDRADEETSAGAGPGPAGPDPVAARVGEVWRELLKVPRIEARDDFFNLGGDSLLVLTMVSQIEKALGCKLDPGLLSASFAFDDFTAAVRTAIQSEAPAPAVAGIHRLQGKGEGVPLFFLHGVHAFRPLVEQLGDDRPVYAMDPPDEATLAATRDFAGLVAVCVDKIRRVRPKGPYLLAGYSLGGLVAFETARSLMADGEVVVGVILLDSDSFGWRPWPWVPRIAMDALALAFRVKLQVLYLAKLPLKRWAGYLSGRVEARMARPQYNREHDRLIARFTLRPLAVPTLLLRCLHEDAGRHRNLGRRWGQLLGDRLRIRDIPADHEDMITFGKIHHLAAHIHEFLAHLGQ